MNFLDYFSAQADDYVKYRPHYPESLFEYLATTTPTHELAWDCGTGNGQAALSLTTYFQQIVATDASEKQITHAFQHDRIRYQVTPAEHTSLEANSVDLITVGQALHWFNFELFYQEVQRVLKPSGAIAVWCYGLFTIPSGTAPLQQTLQEYYQAIESFWPEQRELVEKQYQTIPFPFAEVSPPSFSMTCEWNVDQLIGYLGTWSATQRFIQQQGIDAIAELSQCIIQAWGSPSETKLISWPLSLRVGKVI